MAILWSVGLGIAAIYLALPAFNTTKAPLATFWDKRSDRSFMNAHMLIRLSKRKTFSPVREDESEEAVVRRIIESNPGLGHPSDEEIQSVLPLIKIEGSHLTLE